MAAQQTQREALEGNQYALNYHQVPTGAQPHMYNGGPSRQGIPARSMATLTQDPYYAYWDSYHAYYYSRQYPRPMDQAQYAYSTPINPPVRPASNEANQVQPSQISDFAKELTAAIRTLPTDFQEGIDQTLTPADILRNMHEVDWDQLMMSLDWSQYSGDALARALGEFFHVKELWMQDKERRERGRGKL